MATVLQENVASTLRDGDNPKVAITGMYLALGNAQVEIEQKVKTIYQVDEKTGRLTDKKVDEVKELGKARDGLGIESSSVADLGEDTITGAVRSVLGLCFQYNLNLNDVRHFFFASETPDDGSKANTIDIAAEVNKASKELLAAGIDIGMLKPQTAIHNQSACVAGVADLADMALRGINGKALIVTSDNAKYQLGASADTTGGFGSVAVLVEPADTVKSGIFLSSKAVGRESRSISDFLKPVEDVINEKNGTAIINKYPIVFGEYSEAAYLLLTYRAARASMIEGGRSIEDMKFIIENMVLVPHMPYPTMPKKILSYYIRHRARSDPSLKESLSAQIKDKDGKLIAEPFLAGFNNLERTLKFIVDVEGYVVKLRSTMESFERSREVLSEKIIHEKERKIQNCIEYVSGVIVKELEDVIGSYGLSGKMLLEVQSTIKRLQTMHNDSNTLEDVCEAFGSYGDARGAGRSGILGLIKEFRLADKEYNKKLQDTAEYKQMYKALHIGVVSEYGKKVGNIYTGSTFMALMSYLGNNVDGFDREIWLSGFGSGSESYSIRGKAINPEPLATNIKQNFWVEFTQQKKLTAPEYEAIRCSEKVPDANGKGIELMVSRFLGHTKTNIKKLTEFAASLKPDSSLKNNLRKPAAKAINYA
ncbi:MAG: hydroxymethylglutaryl-CoA synthase family protein [Candidatus Micrarchaeota archaeon]|nr:hydroxymethylglutaryl-CoA synthase family protein [Candidatus Micrarchaeota archaeon]